MRSHCIAMLVALCAIALPAFAHVGDHPSVHDTVANIIERMKKEMPAEQLLKVKPADAAAFLNDEERHSLATEHISFGVNVDVEVYIVHPVVLGDDPFWLVSEGFTKTAMTAKIDDEDSYDIWTKSFPAGHVGLGVNSVSGGGDHYAIVFKPKTAGAAIELKDIYPGQNKPGTFAKGQMIYVDRDDKILTEVPAELDGAFLLRTDNQRRRDCQLVNVFRSTPYPTSAKPEHVVLTWSEDPKTSQTIQWRSSTAVPTGVVAYMKKSDHTGFDKKEPIKVNARTEVVSNPTLLNDPVMHRHTATITGLEPNTAYVYRVGDGGGKDWTDLAEFTTAPEGIKTFSFVYMGDAQNGLDRWGSLVHHAYRTRPDAAFYIMAGDLVNRGAERDDWDTFFANADGVFNNRQVVPALGNHEYQGGDPRLYLQHFELLKNGPAGVEPEHAYAFEYSNALFVVLDSNLEPETQTAWLEEQLANTKATWKFVVYHHPAYSSGTNRDNPEIRKIWGALFDKYHVDLALQGHDHAYLRTYPMKGEQKVGSAAEGTIYIVSVSGTKFYDQEQHDYTEFGMTNVATYQVLDIQISGDRLVYRAYDVEGDKRDEFVIEK